MEIYHIKQTDDGWIVLEGNLIVIAKCVTESLARRVCNALIAYDNLDCNTFAIASYDLAQITGYAGLRYRENRE